MKDKISYIAVYAAVIMTGTILVTVSLFIFVQGISGINMEFLTSTTHEEVELVTLSNLETSEISYENKTTYLEVTNYRGPEVVNVDDESAVLPNEFEISTINEQPVAYLSEEEIEAQLYSDEVTLKVKVSEDGILSMIVATLITIGVSLLFALPIGVISAIYLVEYLQSGRLYNIVHFAIDSLAGIPSIIFGLFGLLFFSNILGLGISLISGSLTVSIMLLPTIIRTTEEALRSVPASYREASLGLGASKLYTIVKVVLPNAMAGIIVAVILAIGRIIGESAILIFTAGTVDKMPTSVFDSSATLTVKAYLLTKEYGDIQTASSIGLVIIAIIVILNIIAKIISKRFNRFA